MAGVVLPAVAWMKKVSQRKAPGAISAIAFAVRPVKPNVGFIVGSLFSAIEFSFNFGSCLSLERSVVPFQISASAFCFGGGAHSSAAQFLLAQAAPACLNLRLLLHHIVAKHEAYFTHDSELVVVQAVETEDGTRREV